MFRFEKLDVWQKAVDFAHGVYAITGRFPAEELARMLSGLKASLLGQSA